MRNARRGLTECKKKNNNNTQILKILLHKVAKQKEMKTQKGKKPKLKQIIKEINTNEMKRATTTPPPVKKI